MRQARRCRSVLLRVSFDRKQQASSEGMREQVQHVVAVIGDRRRVLRRRGRSCRPSRRCSMSSFSPAVTISAGDSAVNVMRLEYGASRSSRCMKSSCRSRSVSRITWRGVASSTSASRFTGVIGGRGIDVAHDALRQRIHRAPMTVAPRPSGPTLLAPPGLRGIEQRRELDRLADVHVHVAEVLAQPLAASAGSPTAFPSPSPCPTARRRNCRPR